MTLRGSDGILGSNRVSDSRATGRLRDGLTIAEVGAGRGAGDRRRPHAAQPAGPAARRRRLPDHESRQLQDQPHGAGLSRRGPRRAVLRPADDPAAATPGVRRLGGDLVRADERRRQRDRGGAGDAGRHADPHAGGAAGASCAASTSRPWASRCGAGASSPTATPPTRRWSRSSTMRWRGAGGSVRKRRSASASASAAATDAQVRTIVGVVRRVSHNGPGDTPLRRSTRRRRRSTSAACTR